MALLLLVVAYLLGSLNGAILLSRLAGRDIRASDMAGTTGAMRQFGLPFAGAVLLFDALKGVLAAWLALRLAPGFAWIVVAAVVAGHCWPAYFAFRGGQGLAPLIGGALVLMPLAALAALIVAAALIALHRPLGLRRLTGLGAVPTSAPVALLVAVVTAWLLYGAGAAGGLLLVVVVLALRAAQVLRRPAPA